MQNRIIAILKAVGPLTTGQLAGRLGVKNSLVYRACHQMERNGQLSSELVKGGSRIFFFPATQEVMESGSYSRIKTVDSRLRSVVGEFSLPGQKRELAAALKAAFRQLIESTGRGSALEKFQEELLEAVMEAKKRGDVTSHLGLRPMHPKTRRWEVGGQLSLIESSS